jgi:hypothetical protein
MKAKIEYLNKYYVAVHIPKAMAVIPMHQWKAAFKRGKSWKRRLQEQKRETSK